MLADLADEGTKPGLVCQHHGNAPGPAEALFCDYLSVLEPLTTLLHTVEDDDALAQRKLITKRPRS